MTKYFVSGLLVAALVLGILLWTDFVNANEKVTICHATSSANNPYVTISVNVNGLNGHGNHPNDIIPAPAGGCPGSGGTVPG